MSADKTASTFPDAEQLVATSTPARFVQRLTSRLRAAAADSSSLTSFSAATARVQRLPATLRLRLAGVFVATFTAAHLALLRWVPPSTRPAMPLIFWMMLALAAVTVAVGAHPFVAAWRARRER